MTRILALTSPARGLLYPIVETALTLRARGHDVHLATIADEVPMLWDLGLGASPLPPALENAVPGDHHDGNHRSVRALTDRLVARADAEFDHLSHLIAQHAPDVVMADVSATGAHLAAEASGLPWAIWSPTFLPLRTDGPPPGLGLRVRPGRVWRARDAALGAVARGVWDRAFLRPLNDLRDRRGLPPVAHTEDIVRGAPLVISLCGPPLQQQSSTWPSSIVTVGPSLWGPPADPDPRVAAISGPLALVTCSTELQDDAVLAHTALDALADSGLHTVVTTGAHDPARFTAHPSATVARLLPHDQVLARADVVITHGGLGITQKALAHGVPLVVVPFGRDQRDVAVRVEAAGVGVRLLPRSMTTRSLRDAVDHAVGLRARVRDVARVMDADGSARRAADALDHLAASARRRAA
ncbi:glycosyltransferase [Williamsia deligens]|uniref:Glycosyltransferase n=1 Tax=Williamsia deligens TaxID=321325 RepID=A0ABW3GA40_9NOCA|nr:glycosyltransferase [Williamsia deligens]MCP2193458.1 glycosyltransferase, MGT family [Williamsia deligens]